MISAIPITLQDAALGTEFTRDWNLFDGNGYIWSKCYIALGSNINHPQHQIQEAQKHLASLKNTSLIKCSPVYKSKPWGYTDQPYFLNAVVSLKTLLSPLELLHGLKDIEQQQRRQPTFKNGPRSLDLDLILYENIQINTPSLILPHPRFHERNFVLIPLFDIAPDLIFPNGIALRDAVKNISFDGLIPFNKAYA